MPKPIIVTITTSEPVDVISERLGDRERFENGRDHVAPGEEQSFIVHAGQSIRVVQPEPEPDPQFATAAGGETVVAVSPVAPEGDAA